MPLAKKKMKSKSTNQGSQMAPGSEGNIKSASVKKARDHKGPINNKHGRNVSIGRK